jgi:hypothetical protein
MESVSIDKVGVYGAEMGSSICDLPKLRSQIV